MTRSSRHALLLALPLLAAGCEEEQLRELHALISICPAEDAPPSACDREVDLGEIPVTVPTSFTAFVVNRGDAPLEVRAVDAEDAFVAVSPPADAVSPGAAVPLALTVDLPADALGAGSTVLTFRSNDEERPAHPIALRFVGVPKPVPDIVVCVDEGATCGVDVAVDFGSVRRTQREGRTLTVKNAGTAPLSIEAVELQGDSSAGGEIQLATSTRPARLAPGDAAPVVVVYQPSDGVDDELTLVLRSDDPDSPEARVALRGSSPENLPPVAVAYETLSQTGVPIVTVDDLVQVDGSASADPEGDPLLYRWTLQAPAGSASALDDADAVRASFSPDRAGTYRVELVVVDSLGQPSDVAAVVLVQAQPRFGFRAVLDWTQGGDLDLHLLDEGGALFGPADCSFENRALDLADATSTQDDCVLLDDATAPPGIEQIVIETPPAGTYGVYVHLFDDLGQGPTDATVLLTIDDAPTPVLVQTRTLPGSCALWHVADVTFPGGALSALDAPIGTLCR